VLEPADELRAEVEVPQPWKTNAAHEDVGGIARLLGHA
jgi:hypothetical protein